MVSSNLPERWLRLTPRPKRVAGAGDERLVRGARIAPGDELHVDRGGFRVAQPLAACEQLLEGVRQELVREHVLPAPEKLPGRDLVEDCRHLVILQSPGSEHRF